MKTETIEWFTPQEKLPENNKPLICITEYGTLTGYYRRDLEEWFLERIFAVPTLWAYEPKGPQ